MQEDLEGKNRGFDTSVVNSRLPPRSRSSEKLNRGEPAISVASGAGPELTANMSERAGGFDNELAARKLGVLVEELPVSQYCESVVL